MKRQSLLRSGASLMLSTLLFAFLASTVVVGQAGTSAVTGAVTDQQGNLVAGATVTLSNSEKNFSRTQTAKRRHARQ